MSEKSGKFQSKSRFGGGRGGKGASGGGKRFESKGFGDRPARDGDRKFGKKPFGAGAGKPFKPRFDRDDRGDRRDGEGFGGKKPFGKKPFGKKPFDGERKSFKPRFDREEGGRDERPARSFSKKPFDGERKSFKPRFDRDDRGDRRDGEGFGGKKPFGKKPFGKKPFDGERKSFKPRFDREEGGRGGRESFKPRFERDQDHRRPQKTFMRKDDTPRARSFDRDDREGGFEAARQKLKSDRPSFGAPSSAFLYGVHAVSEALLNPRRAHQRLLCTENGFAAIEAACRRAAEAGLKIPAPSYVEKEDISRLLPRDAVHQDVLLDTQPLEEIFLADVLISAPADACIVVLDQVTDPHNVGAIIRSAAAFGAVAVVMQKLNAPEVTGTLAKAASGAVEHVPLVREVNLSRALEQMKEAGFHCVGLDERGPKAISALKPGGRTALVMGAEGDGLRRLVAETCDTLARLPTQGAIGSLNVSNAAAVALYEIARSR